MSYLNKIKKTFAQIFPTGRLWNYTRDLSQEYVSNAFVDGEGNVFTDGLGNAFSFTYKAAKYDGRKLLDADIKVIAQVYEDVDKITDSCLPDNDNFDITDVEYYERLYNIGNSGLTLSQRKQIISDRIANSSLCKYKQTAACIENTLRLNGFDVYVHENRIWNGSEFESELIKPAICGLSKFGMNVFGATGYNYTDSVVNQYDDSVNWDIHNIERSDKIFLICGQNKGDIAYISAERKNEFKLLIAQLKPVYCEAALIINYI